jgi:hypothetical protein
MKLRRQISIAVISLISSHLSYAATADEASCKKIAEAIHYFFEPVQTPRRETAPVENFIGNPLVKRELESEITKAAGGNLGFQSSKPMPDAGQKLLPADLQPHFASAKRALGRNPSARELLDHIQSTMKAELGKLAVNGEVNQQQVSNSSLPQSIKQEFPRYLDGGHMRAFNRAMVEPFPFDQVKSEFVFDRFIPHGRKVIVDSLFREFFKPKTFAELYEKTGAGGLTLADGTFISRAKENEDFKEYSSNPPKNVTYLSIEKGDKVTIVSFTNGDDREYDYKGAGYLFKVRNYNKGSKEAHSGFNYSEKGALEALRVNEVAGNPHELVEGRITMSHLNAEGAFTVAKTADLALNRGKNQDRLSKIQEDHRKKEELYAGEYMNRSKMVERYRKIAAKAKAAKKEISIGDGDLSVKLASSISGGGTKISGQGQRLIVKNNGYERLRHAVNLRALKEGRLEIDFFILNTQYAGKLSIDEGGNVLSSPDVDILRHFSDNTGIVERDI